MKKCILMFQFISFLSNLLRGKDYFGDFVKTIIIGFLCYVVGFLVILFKIIFYRKVLVGKR